MKPICLMIAILSCSSAFAVKSGDLFPKVDIAAFKDGVMTAENLKGKVTIMNFWATWCEACKLELKEMQTEFASLLKNDKFQFVFVSLDKDPEKAAKWVRENLKDSEKFLKYLYKDPKFSVAEKLEVDSFPMTFVIDTTGKVVKVHKGFKEGEGSTQKMAKLAKGLL